MDIKEESNIPIILGRPFLAISSAIIDVKRGKLTFEVGEEKIEFILSHFLKDLIIDDTCCFIDIIYECIKELSGELPPTIKELIELPAEATLEENEVEHYSDDILRKCLALTPDLMPSPKKPLV